MSENVGASTSRNPKGLHGLYGDNFNVNMLGVDLKDQMLQPYLLERKKSTK
jgi:hypothetical protein